MIGPAFRRDCTYNRNSSLIEAHRSLYGDGYAGQVPVPIVIVANRSIQDTLSARSAFQARQAHDGLRLRWIEEPKAGGSHALSSAIANANCDALCLVGDGPFAQSRPASATGQACGSCSSDRERMRTAYVVRNVFVRSRSHFPIDPPTTGPPYMARKILTHGVGAGLSLNLDRRYYLPVSAVARSGELQAPFQTVRRLRTATRQWRRPP